MNYRTQTIREALSEGATYNQARNQWTTTRRRAMREQRHAEAVAEHIARGTHRGILPIERDAGGNWMPIAIEDCPRNWTPDRIAAFREYGATICRAISRDPRLADLVAAYVNQGARSANRSKLDRLRGRYGVKIRG